MKRKKKCFSIVGQAEKKETVDKIYQHIETFTNTLLSYFTNLNLPYYLLNIYLSINLK